MKAKDLMIGNLVTLPKGSEKPVIEISKTLVRFENQLFEIEDIEPIPLTEEWLLKFGFTNRDDGSYFIEDKICIRKVDKLNFYRLFNLEYDPIIEYVHQLQNLYFALTGEELEIKNK